MFPIKLSILFCFCLVDVFRSTKEIFHSYGFFWLFVCLEFFVPLENFSLICMETSPLPVKSCKFWPMLGTHGHWAVPHLFWQGASVYTCNKHLRGSVTLTPIAERLAVELSLPVFTTQVCRGWDSNTQTFRLRGKRSNPLPHRRGYLFFF